MDLSVNVFSIRPYRGSDARLTASCFDPNIGSPSPVATRLGTTDINHDSVLRSSLNRPRPLSGTLTSESGHSP